MRPCPSPRTALLGALVSAGVAATMLATATAYAPGPPPPAAFTVQVSPHGATPSTER